MNSMFFNAILIILIFDFIVRYLVRSMNTLRTEVLRLIKDLIREEQRQLEIEFGRKISSVVQSERNALNSLNKVSNS